MIDIQDHIRNRGLLNLFDGRSVAPLAKSTGDADQNPFAYMRFEDWVSEYLGEEQWRAYKDAASPRGKVIRPVVVTADPDATVTFRFSEDAPET